MLLSLSESTAGTAVVCGGGTEAPLAAAAATAAAFTDEAREEMGLAGEEDGEGCGEELVEEGEEEVVEEGEVAAS